MDRSFRLYYTTSPLEEPSSSATVDIMASLADYPYTQTASTILATTANQQIRFDLSIDSDWATTTVNSITAYWIRIRITSAITTGPTLQRIKLGNSRTEINKDGFIERFGYAEKTDTIIFSSSFQSLGSPGSLTYDLSASVTNFLIPGSEFTNNSYKGISYGFVISNSMNTARPFVLTVKFVPTSNASGNVELVLTVVPSIRTGSVVDSGTLTETTSSQVVAVTTAGQVYEADFSFYLSGQLVDDGVVLQVSRDSRGSNPNDTYNNSIGIFFSSLAYSQWS